MIEARPIAPVLALDIGNVCLRIDPQPLLEAIGFHDMQDFREFDSSGRVWGQIQEYEEGRMTTSQFRTWFSSVFPTTVDPHDVDEVWGLLLEDEISGMGDVVKKARTAGMTVIFLSDICPIRYDMILRQLSFSHLVDGAVLSYEVGRHKPHDDMYETMERVHCGGGVPTLYADDLKPNVDAAKRRGWNACLFETAEGLMADLDACLRSGP